MSNNLFIVLLFLSVFMPLDLSAQPAAEKWTLARRVAFSAWLPEPYQSFSLGDGGWLQRFRADWGMMTYFGPPTRPCQSLSTTLAGHPGPCDPQTHRWTILETGLGEQPIGQYANRWVRTRWHLYADRPIWVMPIVWQAFHAYSHRIYSCPPVYVDITAWVTADCTVYLPTVDGLTAGPGQGLAVGLDLTEPFEGWLDVAWMEIWLGE